LFYLIKYLNEKEDEQNKNKKLRTYQRRLSGERRLDGGEKGNGIYWESGEW
jgi:hypothetical protein